MNKRLKLLISFSFLFNPSISSYIPFNNSSATEEYSSFEIDKNYLKKFPGTDYILMPGDMLKISSTLIGIFSAYGLYKAITY